jgi:tRNA (guanosine-2'-O-)-methyltransferase
VRATDKSVFALEGAKPFPAPAEVVVRALAGQVTKERLARIESIAARRIPTVSAVLDDIADPHNASAILRSCDAFGVHHVHAIRGGRDFLASHKVARGTERWVELNQHERAEDCVSALRRDGFQIFVASMEGRHTPDDLGRMDKVAVVLGNEHRGPREDIRALADGTFAIPMVGFVESLNVSVAAAVTLYGVTRGRAVVTPAESIAVVARCLWNDVPDAEGIVDRFLAEEADTRIDVG